MCNAGILLTDMDLTEQGLPSFKEEMVEYCSRVFSVSKICLSIYASNKTVLLIGGCPSFEKDSRMNILYATEVTG